MSEDQDKALHAADALAFSAAALLDHLDRNLNRMAAELGLAIERYQGTRREKIDDAA